MWVYYGLDLLLSKLSKAQSSGEFHERHRRLSCFAFAFFKNGQVRFASLDSQFNINFLRFALKIIFSLSNVFASLQIFSLLSNVFASLRQLFFYCRTCLLRLENNFLITERVRFALKTIFFLSNVLALLRK